MPYILYFDTECRWVVTTRSCCCTVELVAAWEHWINDTAPRFFSDITAKRNVLHYPKSNARMPVLVLSILTPLNFKSLAVSFRANRFNIQKFYMALSLRWVFLRISEQTATFALYSINWLVFITVLGSVYCAVRTDSLYKADYVSSLNG